MERIVTNVKGISVGSEKYPHKDKNRPLYEVNAIVDGVKKEFPIYGDTETFLEILNDFQEYLEHSYTKLLEDTENSLKEKRFKYNLIGLPLYALAFFAFFIGLQIPEIYGFLAMVSSIGIGFSTWYFANQKIYFVDDKLKKRRENLEYGQEKCEILKEKCKNLIKRREILENRTRNEQLRQTIESQYEIMKRKEENVKDLNENILRKNLPPVENNKHLNKQTRKSKFQPDVPEFIRMNRKYNEMLTKFDEDEKEYDVLEQTGRKR